LIEVGETALRMHAALRNFKQSVLQCDRVNKRQHYKIFLQRDLVSAPQLNSEA
jgi:hypothetical protein